MTATPTARPSVLYVCIHNAGRSQMAAAYTHHLSGGAVEVRSAGSEPADQVNPSAVAAMAEEGIDITAETPKILTTDATLRDSSRSSTRRLMSSRIGRTESTPFPAGSSSSQSS